MKASRDHRSDAARRAVAPAPSRVNAMRGWTWTLATLALVSPAVGVVYWPAIDTPFVFDDQDSIANNPSVQQLWPLIGDVDNPGPLLSPKNLPTSGRPLVGLSFAINYWLGGLTPRGFHLVNLAIHVLNAVLLGALVRRTLQLDYFAGRFEATAGWLSLSVALLWAMHPLQSEAVIYITQRTELLVAFFYLSTLYASLRYWTATASGSRTAWLIIASVASLAGMASKEVMVSAPLVVLLYQRTFVSGSFRQAIRTTWPLYLGLAFSWLLLVWLNIDPPRGDSAGFRADVPAYLWWLMQTKVLWMYAKLAVWPWPLVIHYHFAYPLFADALPWLALTILLVAGTAYLIVRNRPAGFLLGAALLVLLPTLVVPIYSESAAERRMYLPLAALISLVVAGGYALAVQLVASKTSVTARRLAIAALMVVTVLLVLCGLVIAQRVPAYADSLALWQDTLRHQPENATAHKGLADAFVHAGRNQEAIPEYQRAIELKSHAPQYVYSNYGVSLLVLNRLPEAIEQFENSLRLSPDYVDANNNLGYALVIAGRPEQALVPLRHALELNPRSAQVRSNLGQALAALGRTSEAIEQFEQALQLKPDYAEVHDRLGLTLFLSGQKSAALKHFQEAAALMPSLTIAQFHLGMALLDGQQAQEAISHLRRAVEQQPDFFKAWANLGAAYAQAGQPTEALTATRKALELARSQGQTAAAQQLEQWLETHGSRSSSAEPNDAPMPASTLPPGPP